MNAYSADVGSPNCFGASAVSAPRRCVLRDRANTGELPKLLSHIAKYDHLHGVSFIISIF